MPASLFGLTSEHPGSFANHNQSCSLACAVQFAQIQWALTETSLGSQLGSHVSRQQPRLLERQAVAGGRAC